MRRLSRAFGHQVKILAVEGLRILVSNLEALDATILDIKPRLSSEAMNRAAEVTAKVHAVRLLAVMVVYVVFPAIEAQVA